jgi:hypothetical protein
MNSDSVKGCLRQIRRDVVFLNRYFWYFEISPLSLFNSTVARENFFSVIGSISFKIYIFKTTPQGTEEEKEWNS